MPPTQLKGPPFSFVIPHSGTRPFYGTQRHLGISKCEIWVQAVFPSFTPCFETTVLAYLPTLVLLLLLPVDLTILSKSAARDVSFIAKKKEFPDLPCLNLSFISQRFPGVGVWNAAKSWQPCSCYSALQSWSFPSPSSRWELFKHKDLVNAIFPTAAALPSSTSCGCGWTSRPSGRPPWQPGSQCGWQK